MHNTRPAPLFGLLALSLFSAAIVSSISALSGTAFAQGQSDEKADQAKTMYKPEYPQAKADSRNSFTVQTNKHLYKPGEEVSVEGSIWSSLLTQLGDSADMVTIQVTDNKGTGVADEEAEINDNGEYSASFTLPEDADLGAYTMDAKINVDAGVLDTLQASITAKIETSAKFEVVSPVAFAVKAEGREFDVNVASNSSSVTDFAFAQAEKKVSFKVEGETGTKGVAQVTLPKELLAGQLMVSIDGRAVAEDSNDVIVTSDTATEMTLEINYPHSEHTIEITGTSVVPEFPVSILVMAISLGSILVLAVAKNRGNWFNGFMK
jgi:uncharacterized protein YdeI (BOF family)